MPSSISRSTGAESTSTLRICTENLGELAHPSVWPSHSKSPQKQGGRNSNLNSSGPLGQLQVPDPGCEQGYMFNVPSTLATNIGTVETRSPPTIRRELEDLFKQHMKEEAGMTSFKPCDESDEKFASLMQLLDKDRILLHNIEGESLRFWVE